MKQLPNENTGPNAGGPRRCSIRTSRAARVGQLCRSTMESTEMPARLGMPGSSRGLGAVSWCVVAFTVCIHAIWNLITDVERGYSPRRCQLAAVLLLLAFSLSGWLVLGLIRAALQLSLT